MFCRARNLTLGITLALLAAGKGHAQTPNQGQAYMTPPCGPPACAPFEDDNGPLLKGNPLLDSPAFAPPGWFAALEVDVVGAHIKNQLISAIPIGPLGDQVRVQQPALDWTGTPRLDLCYRLAQGSGELLASYRNLTTSGSELFGSQDLHSRLNLNVIDLDYGGREYSLLPKWDMKWLAGVRMANVFFDARSTTASLEQKTSDYWYGAGPHVRLDLTSHPENLGLSLFARVDAAYLLFGEVSQAFEEVVTTSPGSQSGAAYRETHNQPVPVVGFQAGLDWRSPWNPDLSFAAGYTLERWFVVADVQQSHGDVTIQGVFVRAAYRY
jgi:hypothetical protein